PEPQPTVEPEPETIAKTDADYLQENPTRALLRIRAAQQPDTILRPWQKDSVKSMEVMGTYLGDGRVLTAGQVAKDATYIELSLPDGSKTAPAQIISYDPDINLAIIGVSHEKDQSIFEDRLALPLGEALRLGDKAEYWGVISGKDPLRIPISVKSGDTVDMMPRLMLQSPQSILKDESFGYPIVSEGKLVGLSSGFNAEQQTFSAINGELIARFLKREAQQAHSVPVLGISITPVDDPVMSRYLQLDEGESGVYLSEVSPLSAAQSAGLQPGDVILAVKDYKIDNQGQVQHPLYGRISVHALLRSLLPLGESLSLHIKRKGEEMDISVPLNRDAAEKAPIPSLKVKEQVRYIIHGGLLFQPLSTNYLDALKAAANGTLPEEFLTLKARSQELIDKGYQELSALSLVIPSPAVLGYESLAYCLVEQVNGKAVTSFDQLAQLLDEPTSNGITSISINKPPYTIYLKQADAQQSNDLIRRKAIPQLRQLNRNSTKDCNSAQQ
ncbi:MAG: PDZ domain-containing protein, partial [Akkermansia sp.]